MLVFSEILLKTFELMGYYLCTTISKWMTFCNCIQFTEKKEKNAPITITELCKSWFAISQIGENFI